MAYTVITLGEFLDQLSTRLDDPTNSFFTRDEVLSYTTEALRTWAAHTGYWVRRAEFLTTSGVKDYDITNLAKYNPGSGDIYPIQLTVTDRELINSLCYSLLEPPITSWPGGWVGTEQFSLQHILDWAKLSINAIQLRDGLIGQANSQIVSPVPINQYDMPNDIIGLRSIYWQTVENKQYPLARSNQYVRQLISDPGTTPDSYSMVGVIPRKIELSPVPTDTGTLVYIYIPGHNDLSPTTIATTLYIPTNFSWAAKWYALYNLLNAEGELRDKFRADYCQMRIKDSRIVASLLPGILRAYIDGVEVGTSAVFDANTCDPNWRNLSGSPDNLLIHTFNLISLSRIPGVTSANPTGEYSISFDLAANAPIPTNEADYLDLSNDVIEPLIAYAHHLACFKLGGQEFAESIPAYEHFLRSAMKYNAKLSAESGQFELLKEKASLQKKRKPISVPEEED